jgi:hypothetical protein
MMVTVTHKELLKMAVLDVEGSRFTKELTGPDLLKYLMEHFDMTEEEAKKNMKDNQDKSLFIRADK